MPTLRKFTPASESALHLMIQAELDAIEQGLQLLQHEYPSGKGILDFLCIDDGGRLVIIEVKLHEDENILFQSLKYFSDVDKHRYLIASMFTDRPVVPDQPPRVFLISEHFSEDVRRLSTLVVPEVELYEYTAFRLPDGKETVYFHPVSLPVAWTPPGKPSTIDSLVEYLKDHSLLPVLSHLRETIIAINPKTITEYSTLGYIGYKHSSGRQFAYIRVNRKSLELGAHLINERRQLLGYEGVRLETGEEDCSGILERIRESLDNLIQGP